MIQIHNRNNHELHSQTYNSHITVQFSIYTWVGSSIRLGNVSRIIVEETTSETNVIQY